MLKVLSSILCDLDPKEKIIGQKAGICDGVPSTSALVWVDLQVCSLLQYINGIANLFYNEKLLAHVSHW